MAGLYPLLVVHMFSFRLGGCSSCCLPFWFIYREPCVPPLNPTSVASSKVHLCSAWGSGAETSELLIPGDVEQALCGLCSQVQKAVEAVVLRSLGLCPEGLQVCSHPSQTQTAWANGRRKCWSCILSLLLPYYLFDLARVSQSFEANDHQPPAAFLRLQAVEQLEAVMYDHIDIVHSALRLQQTSNYLVWCKTWKLLKWNNISFHSEIY